jgi:branched-chain amino acid transport system substrate-binding protein
VKAPSRTRTTLALAGALLLLGACGVNEEPDTTADQEPGTAADDTDEPEQANFTDEVTIGVMGPLTGGFSEIGENIVEGAELAARHINEDGGLLAGTTEVVIAVRDAPADPEVATQASRDFINEGTPLLAGILSSADCFAAAPVIEDLGGVLVSSTCSSNNLTGIIEGEAPFQRAFFLAVRDLQMARGLAAVVAAEYPEMEVFDVFGYDYDVGHDMWDNFIAELRDVHGMDVAINQEHFVPFGESNYRTQISALSRGLQGTPETRGLFLSMFGAGTAAFLQQQEAFDLTDEYGVVLNSGSYYPVARTLDGAAPEIWNSYDYHHEAFDTEMNDRFVADFEAEHGRLPVSWAYQGYTAITAYAAAIEAAGDTDPDAVVEALKGLEFESPRGSLYMNPDTHLAESDVLIKHTIGNPDAMEGVEFLDAFFVPVEETLR